MKDGIDDSSRLTLGAEHGALYVVFAVNEEQARSILENEEIEAVYFDRDDIEVPEEMERMYQNYVSGGQVALLFPCTKWELAELNEQTWRFAQTLKLSSEESLYAFSMTTATYVQHHTSDAYWRLRDQKKKAGRDNLVSVTLKEMAA